MPSGDQFGEDNFNMLPKWRFSW